VPASPNRDIQTAKNVLKKHQMKSSRPLWFGKKVYLGYSKEAGWKVYELNIFGRILRKLNLKYQDTHLKRVVKKLKKLSDEERVDLIKTLPHLRDMFKEVQGDKFRKMGNGAMNLPSSEQKSEPSKTSRSQTETPKPLVSPEAFVSQSEEVILPETKREETVSILSPLPGENEKANEVGKIREEISRSGSPPATSPLYLSNYKSSRCYLDSVLEMMLSQDEIRQKIFIEYARKDINDKKKEVLKAIMDLILIVDETKGKGQGPQSPEGKNSPGERVREAIFKSKLEHDLSNPAKIYHQQDAGAVLLLINEILDNSIDVVEEDKSLGEVSIVASRPPEKQHKLVIPLEEHWENHLTILMENYFSPHFSGDTRKFELGDGTEVSLPYTTQPKLKSFPDTISLQLLRNKYDMKTGTLSKISDPVYLPDDGIVNLPYQDGKKKGSYEYEITGYVEHHGTQLGGGHYTANVKIGEKYYTCDDLNSKFYKEISKDQFYKNQNAYLVMLKRVHEEAPGEAE